jgi:hypothetical protein
LLDDVEAQAATVLRSIGTLAPANGASVSTPSRPFDATAAQAALQRLQSALTDFDLSTATAALSELDGGGVPHWAAEDVQRLRESVDRYEYDEARGVASRLLERLRIESV